MRSKIILHSKAFIGLVILALSSQLNAQEPNFAPLNPEYKKYIEQKAAGLEKRTGEQQEFFGYVPSPMKFNFGRYETLKPSIKKNLLSTDYPATYDLRFFNYVTSVKNQGSSEFSGNCWSFATIGAIESNWLVNHYGQYNLSEQNMINCHGYEWDYGEGGNALLATAYLTRLAGPCLESEDQYITSQHNCKGQLTVQRDIVECKFLPYDIDIIKDAVMKYGGVYITMRAGGSAAYYNDDDYTWYYNGDNLINDHAVLIIGWNDNILVTGGPRSPQGTHGAWLVKNSWGTNWGNNGFFYLSYYDKAAYSEVMYLPTSNDTSKFGKINMYDQLGATTSFRPQKQDFAYALTRFNAPDLETLTKVGTFINSVGTVVDIEIYDDFGDDSLTHLIASRYNMQCDFPGYKTFDIYAQVEGDYYVKVKYYTPGYEFPIPVEYPIEGFALPDIMGPGTNWISADGYTWDTIGTGIADKEMDLTIRTYTANSSKPLAHFILPEDEICSGDSILLIPEGIDTNNTYIWHLPPDGNPLIDTTYEPFYAHFNNSGEKDIKLVVDGTSGSDSIIQKVTYSDNINVLLVSPYPVISMGKETQLIAVCDCDSFIWDAPYNEINEPIITITPADTGENIYGIIAYNNSCWGTDSITIIAKQNPVNDDVCNALELTIGDNGPFTNYNATVESGEPAPIEGECNEPLQWCKEGGLQNSVWFKFTVPESDSISIITSGFDSQIAIYDAVSCSDILNNDFTLVAANDDYFGEDQDYAAAIMELSGLTPLKEYYLQLDGSAGGVESEFNIELVDLGGGSTPVDGSYFIYYDDGSKQLCISFSNESIPEVLSIIIIDVSGREKYQLEVDNSSNSNIFYIDCQQNLIGNNVYIVKLKTESIDDSQKIYIPMLK